MPDTPHPYVQLALESVRHYLAQGRDLPEPDNLSADLRKPAASFVSIKKAKELRGCIGTLIPSQHNLAKEIIHNAVSAAVRDPRFSPVSESELDTLSLSVDVLTPLEKVSTTSELDCRRYGLVIKCGDRQGVLLPDLESVRTVEKQVDVCLQKGGIREDEDYELYRFEVKRYH